MITRKIPVATNFQSIHSVGMFSGTKLEYVIVL
jgi:hypothetical protein